MMQIIRHWKDLADLVQHSALGNQIFRGVDNCEFDLRPKIGRPRAKVNRDGSEAAFDAAAERQMLHEFKARSVPYYSDRSPSDLEWLAIAQHHGMPTRLLDWTESVLVAAYFATESAGTKGTAAIYSCRGLPVIDNSENPFTSRVVKMYWPPHLSPRIPAQRGVFTVHPNPAAAFSDAALRMWQIPAAACLEIKDILDACAVNRASLFPDLDGLAQHLGWLYKWGKLPPTR